MGARFGSQNGIIFWPPKLGLFVPPIKILIWGSFLGQKRGQFLGPKKGPFLAPFFGKKKRKMSISGPHFWIQFLPPPQRISGPHYVATFVSLELGPSCAMNRLLTIQTTLDSRVLVLSQQCPRWQATYNGQNAAEATLVERGLCSSTWTRPPSPSTMVSRKAWSYSLSLRRQELSQ